MPGSRRPHAPRTDHRRAEGGQRRRRRPAGSGRRRTARRRAGGGARRGARDGLDHVVRAPAARASVRQHGPQPVSDHAARRARLVVEDLRGAAAAAGGRRRSTARRCTSTTSTSAPRCSNGVTRRSGSPRSSPIATCPVPKLVLGDFNEWMKGLVTSTLSARLNSVDLRDFLRQRRTYPGVFPLLHLDHIYYAGHLEIVGIELPRTRLSLVASDHLPLVADVRVEGRNLRSEDVRFDHLPGD